jgi:prephenate dehydrogenase
MFDKVVIVGVGLIGGSFALGLKPAGAARTIVGWSAREALARRWSSASSTSLARPPLAALRGADWC